MKPARSLITSAVAGLALAAFASPSPADTLPLAPGVAPPASTPDPIAALIAPIRSATEPSLAIEAYANAQARYPGDPAIELAYVQRMVDFGLPEIAAAQAQDLIRRNSTDGVPWAVTAYLDAKRDRPGQALWELNTALKNAPDDPFVVRTAGRLFAWYDTRVDKTKLLGSTIRDLELARAKLAKNSTYVDAYENAVTANKAVAEAPATASAPAAVPTAPAYQAPAAPYAASPVYNADTYTSSIPYTTPYDLTSSFYYPDYSFSYYPHLWWPTFSTFVIVDRDFFRHHHHFDHRSFDHSSTFFGNRSFFPHHTGSFVASGGSAFVTSRSGTTIQNRVWTMPNSSTPQRSSIVNTPSRSTAVMATPRAESISPFRSGPTFYTSSSPFTASHSVSSPFHSSFAAPTPRFTTPTPMRSFSVPSPMRSFSVPGASFHSSGSGATHGGHR